MEYRVVVTREGERRTLSDPPPVNITARSKGNPKDVIFVDFYADPPKVGDILRVTIEKEEEAIEVGP